MKGGLVRGMAATVEADVTEAMVARLDGRIIHPVLGTASLVEWIEWAGRKLIIPYLLPNEDAVGYRIELIHLHPVRIGEHFTATAEFVSIEDNRVLATVYADGPRGRMAQGSFTQVVLEREALARRLAIEPDE
jgi:predicted thioesterase